MVPLTTIPYLGHKIIFQAYSLRGEGLSGEHEWAFEVSLNPCNISHYHALCAQEIIQFPCQFNFSC